MGFFKCITECLDLILRLDEAIPGQTTRAPGAWDSLDFQVVGACSWPGRQPYSPATFNPKDNPGTHFG